MNKKFMLTIVLCALLGTGWTFPALAQDHDGDDHKNKADEATGRAQERQDRIEARQDVHKERHDARSERRAALNDAIQMHRDCIDQAVLDVRPPHEANDTGRGDRSHVGEAVRACNETFREQVHEINTVARERYQLTKERTRDGDECTEACANHRIANLEKQKMDAEDRLARLRADLDRTEDVLALAEASGNATDEQIFTLEDTVFGIKIRMLQVERMILHIDAKIDKWSETDRETD